MIMRILLMVSMTQMLLWGGAGDLDSTFGGDGMVTTDFENGADTAFSVATQSDGKIVAAGWAYNNSNYDFAVVRYDTNGSLDSEFGDDGKVMTTVGSSSAYLRSVAIQSDGKIVAAGYTANNEFAVVRYDTNGSLDSDFGNDGKAITDVGGIRDQAYSVAIQSDSKIVVAGYSEGGDGGWDFAVVRYDTNGSLDSDFSNDGKVITAVGRSGAIAHSVAIQSDGKIVAAGSGYNGIDNDFAVVRYDTNGSLDSDFGSDGIVMTNFGIRGDEVHSVAIQSDGKIVAAGVGYNGSDDDFAVVRYNTNGSLDSDFGNDGKVMTPIGSSRDQIYGVAIQNDGKIIVAGRSNDGVYNYTYDFAVVRYNTNGSLDNTFANDGKVITDVGDSFSGASGVAIQRDGNIIVAGSIRNSSNDFIIVRYIGGPITLSPIYYLLQ